jgi:hypothetical protein
MSKFLALSVACIAATSSAAFAQAVFDSPGRGYREQRDRLAEPKSRISPEVTFLKARDAQFSRLWEDLKNSDELESVALFFSDKQRTEERIHRELTNAGIPFLITEDTSVVKVDAARVTEAKKLLRKLAAAEGRYNVRTVTMDGDQLSFDRAE